MNQILAFIMIAVLIIYIILRRNPSMVKPAGVISGTAKTSDGKPVDGASISLLDSNANVVASTTSAADGTFTLPSETLGNYHIRSIKANPDGSHLQGDVDVVLDAATKSVDIPMECFFEIYNKKRNEKICIINVKNAGYY